MSNIFDYLEWRGDLSFDAAPFNEVDNYILSKVGTPDMTGVVPSGWDTVSLTEAVNNYLDIRGDSAYNLGILASPSIVPAMVQMTKTIRFKDLRLSGFINSVIPERTEQFSALTITMPGHKHYVSFRGTDDTILAWKENCLFSTGEQVAARTDAVRYLEWVASRYSGELIIGGHSKGGNLAVYAAACVPAEIQDRITAVYSNDGPGFLPDFYETEGFRRISTRIHTLLPQHSIVGLLLTQVPGYEIVASSVAGAAAHDGFNWEVSGNSFVHCGSFSKSSQMIEAALDHAVFNMSVDERKAFIEEIFGAFEQAGVVFVSDLTDNTLKKAMSMIESLKEGSEAKRFLVFAFNEIKKEFLPLGRKKKNVDES